MVLLELPGCCWFVQQRLAQLHLCTAASGSRDCVWFHAFSPVRVLADAIAERKMQRNLAGSLLVVLFLAPFALADLYMHNPRGSNNRLNEQSAARDNGNRMFDSQVQQLAQFSRALESTVSPFAEQQPRWLQRGRRELAEPHAEPVHHAEPGWT